jgi:hypothetical protein
MNKEELRIKQAAFEGNRQGFAKTHKALEKLRLKFIAKFSLDELRNMPVEKYALQKGKAESKDTFCYWIETALKELGNIKGSTAFKFGIYYGITNSDSTLKYRFTSKWGTSPEEAYQRIRQSIIELILAGESNDKDVIKKSLLSKMFKGKILSTYFPDKFLNIFSEEHLDHYIAKFGIEDPLLLDEIDKREHLMKFKNRDAVMENWSIYEFGRFLYTQIGPPVDGDKSFVKGKEGISPELAEYIDIDYAKISQVKPTFVDLDIKESMPTESKSVTSGRKKVDFEKENRKNKRLGDRGEKVVLLAEKDYLTKSGKKDLAQNVKQVSKEDDSLGYDILSYELDGSEKYIEVKSTKSKVGTANFLISDNQIRKSKSKDNFFIYVVFESNQKNPKIWRIKSPFNEPENRVKVTPVSYRVVINLKEK